MADHDRRPRLRDRALPGSGPVGRRRGRHRRPARRAGPRRDAGQPGRGHLRRRPPALDPDRRGPPGRGGRGLQPVAGTSRSCSTWRSHPWWPGSGTAGCPPAMPSLSRHGSRWCRQQALEHARSTSTCSSPRGSGSSPGSASGVLAGVQTRSIRDLEQRQAPYVATHQLMSQLHDLASRGEVGLDSVKLATELAGRLRDGTGATGVAVYGHAWGQPLVQLAGQGDTSSLASHALGANHEHKDDVLVIGLRGAGHQLGSVVLKHPRRLDGRVASRRPGRRRRVRPASGHRRPLRRGPPPGDRRGAQAHRPGDARRCRPGARRARLHRRRDRLGLGREPRPSRWPTTCAARSAGSSPRSATRSSTFATTSPTTDCPARWPTTSTRSPRTWTSGSTSSSTSPGPHSPRGPSPSSSASPRRRSATCASTHRPTISGSRSCPTAPPSCWRSRTTASATPGPRTGTGGCRACRSAPPASRPPSRSPPVRVAAPSSASARPPTTPSANAAKEYA